MSKERLKLKEFINYIDFLDDSQDMQDHGRFIDTLQSLYEDGWFDWLYLYAKEQSEQAERFEILSEHHDESLKQNERYREAIKRAIGKFNYDEHQEGMSILQKALEGEE